MVYTEHEGLEGLIMQGPGRPACPGFSLPQDRDPVGYIHGFFQLMGDEYQAFTLFLEQPKKRKKPLGFLWGEDRRRFIENQVLYLSKQEGKDCGFLPLAYGEILRIPVQGQIKTPAL
jgi:hypothetical protein